ncbi:MULTISPECIES: DUF1127 domain-containing protein [unclassified Pseudomonas]|uniref:DUF1127 domain-containing protein n=1 Tax=unclassified Pseudomonas TaxID=196821 RepID=UPI00131F48D3|nr:MULTISPECIES: DUF1127 domain-containing protein [unclassified Pseudomonas]NWA83213.1 DUF1127 domain-containing protein [Pseudomonas sp. D2002]QHD04351.1 hypothetical protein PspR76_00730 [Pseudomonas sp. R76]
MNTQTSSAKRLILRTAHALARWARQTHERHQLAQLDPRELSDAGISQGDRMAELSKPFWRD